MFCVFAYHLSLDTCLQVWFLVVVFSAAYGCCGVVFSDQVFAAEAGVCGEGDRECEEKL